MDKTCETIVEMLDPRRQAAANGQLLALEQALERTRDFTDQIKTANDQEIAHRRHVSALHAIDHLGRLLHRCRQTDRHRAIKENEDLQNLAKRLSAPLMREYVLETPDPGFVDTLNGIRKEFRESRESFRAKTIGAASLGVLDTERAIIRLDSVRWLHRVSYHLWRIAYHLEQAAMDVPEKSDGSEIEREPDLD